jgi:hypothetical protein
MPFGVEVLIFWRIPAVHLGQYLDGTDSIRRFDIPQIQFRARDAHQFFGGPLYIGSDHLLQFFARRLLQLGNHLQDALVTRTLACIRCICLFGFTAWVACQLRVSNAGLVRESAAAVWAVCSGPDQEGEHFAIGAYSRFGKPHERISILWCVA